MEQQEQYILATYICNEIKKNFKLANTSKRNIESIYIFESESGWNVSIPEHLYNKKLHVKGVSYNKNSNFVDQSIMNGINKYLVSTQQEGMVSIQ